MNKSALWIVCLGAMLLAACAAPAAAPDTVEPGPAPGMATVAAVTPDVLIVTATPTVAPSVTAVAQPTEPPTLGLPTSVPSVTPEGSTIPPGALGYIASTSPDGQWTAETTILPSDTSSMRRVTFVVRNADGTTEWTLIDEARPDGLGAPYPTVVHWAQDGQSFFYTEHSTPDGLGGSYEQGLYQVHLSAGASRKVSDLEGFIAQAVSPDTSTLAYAAETLILRDLATGMERRIALGLAQDEALAQHMWSPDGAALLVVVKKGEDVRDEGSWAIFRLDVASGTLTPLIRDSAQRFWVREWTQPEVVSLTDGEGNWWELNPATGELIQVGEPIMPVTVTDEATPIAPPPDIAWIEAPPSLSPDGRWQVVVAESDFFRSIAGGRPWYASRLTVRDVTSGEERFVARRIYADGFPHYWPAIVQWSQDGARMYYTYSGAGDGCDLFGGQEGLYRADLTTGVAETIVPAEVRHVLALSPDESQIIYPRWDAAAQRSFLVLRDVATGAEQAIPLDSVPQGQMGNIVWSPTGDALLLVVATDACSDTWAHTILKVDLATNALTTLVPSDARHFRIVSWDDPTTATLTDADNKLWLLNVATGDLSEK